MKDTKKIKTIKYNAETVTSDEKTIDVSPNKIVNNNDLVRFNIDEDKLSLKKIIERKDLTELDAALGNSKGYLLGITLLTKDDKLVTHLATYRFPKLDYLPSCKKLHTLLVEELEKVNDEFGDVEVL